MTNQHETDVRDLVDRWIKAITACDIDGIVADHADDIVMYDVPPPSDGVRGLADYRKAWEPFSEFMRAGATFELLDLDVTAGPDVAFAHGLLRCGTPKDLADHPEYRLRLTIGLRKRADRWVITHEHHSFPLCDQPATT